MSKAKNKKTPLIVRLALVFIITTLSLFLAFVALRFVATKIAPESEFALLFEEYFGAFADSVDALIGEYVPLPRAEISEYQQDVVEGLIENYLAVVRMQQTQIMETGALKSERVDTLSEENAETLKKEFYRFHIENPYLKSLTFFDMNGKTLLHLFLERGWNIELKERLIAEVKNEGTLILHSDAEQTLYCLSYYNKNGFEYIVSTRTDKRFIADIVAYCNLGDKTFIIRDSHNNPTVIAADASTSGQSENQTIALIGKYAEYKETHPAEIKSVPGLTITLVEKRYSSPFGVVLALVSAAAIAFFLLIFYLLFLGIRAGIQRPKKKTPPLARPSSSPEGKTREPLAPFDLSIDDEPIPGDYIETAAEALNTAPAASFEPSKNEEEPDVELSAAIDFETVRSVQKAPPISSKKERDEQSARIAKDIDDIFAKFDEALASIAGAEKAGQPKESPPKTGDLANKEKSDIVGKKKFTFKIDDKRVIG